MSDNPRKRLLNDLSCSDPIEEENTRKLAIQAFRRGHIVRKMTQGGALAASIVAVGLGFFLNQNRGVKSVHREGPLEKTGQVAPFPTLSDEELIASFPPNSCYLAEVDGRQVLVFKDANFQEAFYQKGQLVPRAASRY